MCPRSFWEMSKLMSIFLFGSVLTSYILYFSRKRKRCRHFAANTLSEEFRSTVVVSRIHRGSTHTFPDVSNVILFLSRCLQYCERSFICIEAEESDSRDYITLLQEEVLSNFGNKVSILSISPWGKFTFPLNVALLRAANDGFKYIIYQSLEFEIKTSAVKFIMAVLHSKPHIVCVGLELPGHEFRQGDNELRGMTFKILLGHQCITILQIASTGRTCPWNTFACWNVSLLSLVGFPMISDLGKFGGVEEVAAIALLQHLKPDTRAVLMRPEDNNMSWNTNFLDPLRSAYHESKMKSKDERPATQLAELGIKGSVIHICQDNISLL